MSTMTAPSPKATAPRPRVRRGFATAAIANAVDQAIARTGLPPAPPALGRGGEAAIPSIGGVRERLGLTQEELARAIGSSLRTVAAWQAGRPPASPAAVRKLVEASRLGTALGQIMPRAAVGGWLRSPNAAFDGQTPIQVMERGESDRLWRMIFEIDANVAN